MAPTLDGASAAALVHGDEVRGHVYDPLSPEARRVVELLADGMPVGLARADLHVRALEDAGMGDGCFGFVFVVPRAVLANCAVLEVRAANTGTLVGTPIRLGLTIAPPSGGGAAHVRWLGGLRLSGHLPREDRDGATRVKALIDGQVVSEVPAAGWTHVERGETWHLARAFDLILPERFADGRVRPVEVVTSSGAPVEGSPCAVIAFPDGLAAFIDGHADLESETLRARIFDQLLPQSLPIARFAQWSRRFPGRVPSARPRGTVAVAFVGERALEASLDTLEGQVGCAWVAASLPDSGAQGTFGPRDLGDFLAGEARDCPTIVFALSGTRLSPTALASLHDALAEHPAAVSAYADVSVTIAQRASPVFLSAFDYERCLEQGCGAFLFATRRDAALAASAGGAASIFRAFNAVLDHLPAEEACPVHIPGVLAQLPPLAVRDLAPCLLRATDAHLRARRVPARLATGASGPGVLGLFPAVRVTRVSPRARVSVLVPTRNRLDLLQACLGALAATAVDVDHEVVVIDNDSSDPETLEFLGRLSGPDVRVLRVPGPFNYAALNNAAAERATGEVLLFLNNDVAAREPGWLAEMMGRLGEPDVGAVGALLSWPSGVVQHGGVTLGPNFSAVEAFQDRIEGDPGYGDLLHVAHECSAVTAACLLTRRQVFRAHGGFDAVRFPINYNDVDYCLKLRASGLRIVFTPYARLWHREASSRGRDLRPDQKARSARELANLRNMWGEVLAADPFYTPLMSLDALPYSALAWPPRPASPRQRRQKPSWPLPLGS